MRYIIAACVLLAGANFTLAQPSTAPSTAPGQTAVIIPLKGEVNDFMRKMTVLRVDRARQQGAQTIILQINTYGGLVSSALDISRFLKQQSDLHTIAFVDDKAISAGAMIALACDEIIMEPHALLGDCAPIAMTMPGAGATPMQDTERAKAESPILEDFYDSAVRNGYDPYLVQSMVTLGRVVHWIQGPQGETRFVNEVEYERRLAEGWKPVEGVRDPLDAKDTLLTVGTDLARRLGLASGTASSPEEFAASRELDVAITFRPAVGELLIGLLSSTFVRSLLTVVLLLATYSALTHPGQGIPEVVLIGCLGALLGVPFLTGYAQWWEILAVLVGLVLLAIEVFIFPGFGATGIAGILLLIFGLVMTWAGNEPVEIPGVVPQLSGTWDALQRGLMIVIGGMFSSLLLFVWLQRYLPHLPYFNKLILTTTSGALTSEVSSVPAAAWPLVGARGRVVTDLRPGGTVAFADESLGDTRIADVVSEGGFIPAGREVVVREVHGTHVVVRAVS